MAIRSSSRWRTMTGSCCCSMAPRWQVDRVPSSLADSGPGVATRSSTKPVPVRSIPYDSNGPSVKYQRSGGGGKRPAEARLLFLEPAMPKNTPSRPFRRIQSRTSPPERPVTSPNASRRRPTPRHKASNFRRRTTGTANVRLTFRRVRRLHKRLSCAKTYDEMYCLERNDFSKPFPRLRRRGRKTASSKGRSWEFMAGLGLAPEHCSDGARPGRNRRGPYPDLTCNLYSGNFWLHDFLRRNHGQKNRHTSPQCS